MEQFLALVSYVHTNDELIFHGWLADFADRIISKVK